MLYDAVRRLGSREKRIVHLRYGLHGGSEHTQKEVADMYGHLPKLHLPPGEAHREAIAERNAEDGLKALRRGAPSGG